MPITVGIGVREPRIYAWEINVNYCLGKLHLPVPPCHFIPKERKRHLTAPLDLSENDTVHLCKLPMPHKDPFDRMLVCQAIEHSLTILSPDPLITQYTVHFIGRHSDRIPDRSLFLSVEGQEGGQEGCY